MRNVSVCLYVASTAVFFTVTNLAICNENDKKVFTKTEYYVILKKKREVIGYEFELGNKAVRKL